MKTLPDKFQQTCNKPYDRHQYKIVFSNGNEVILDDYMDVQAYWFQTPSDFLSHVEIIDATAKKSRGFK